MTGSGDPNSREQGLAMKKFLIATIMVAALASGGVAAAADLQVDVRSPPRQCGGGAFHGWYVGIHAGSLSHEATRTDQDAFLNFQVPAAATYVQTTTSTFGGAQ